MLDFIKCHIICHLYHHHRHCHCHCHCQVMALFESRGWTAIINDNLISNVLLFGTVLLSLVVCVLSVILGSLMGLTLSQLVVAGLVVGVCFGSVLSSCVNSAVAMIFVCFAESQETWSFTHPTEFLLLSDTWRDHSYGLVV